MMTKRVGITYGDARKLEPYAAALRQAGAEPVPIAPHEARPAAGLEGLLLAGGTDVNPELYGEPRGPRTHQPDDARDRLESALLREALEMDLPVLGICRGLQLFNVVHGGTLEQHIEGHRVRTGDPSLRVHDVEIVPGSRLAEILGSEPLAVNSRHHQAVGRLGGGLLVAARSAGDGVVEALERPDRRFALAVEWHPEDQIRDARQRRLFKAFAEAL